MMSFSIERYHSQRRVIEDVQLNEIKDLTKIKRSILNTGGYCLLFVQLERFPEWFESFS